MMRVPWEVWHDMQRHSLCLARVNNYNAEGEVQLIFIH